MLVKILRIRRVDFLFISHMDKTRDAEVSNLLVCLYGFRYLQVHRFPESIPMR